MLILIMLLCSLTGCSGSDNKTDTQDSVLFHMEPLYTIQMGGGFEYYRDTVTDVMYIWYWSMERGGLTEMTDPETGFPLTYERYKELAESKYNITLNER